MRQGLGKKRTGMCWRCGARVWIMTGYCCSVCFLKHNGNKQDKEMVRK